MTADLCFTPATELAARIRDRDVSPVEVTQAVLDRIERHDGRINAFAHRTTDLALDTARAAERAVMRGDTLGPLQGVPVTIKDLHQLAGHPLAAGSRTQAGQIAAEDAPVAARLKAAGAVILGKTTTPEFGWTGISRSPLTGITHNPWRHGLNAGGSSTGAAASAAAGFGPLHQGSDGAGSIRMPSHFLWGVRHQAHLGDDPPRPGPQQRQRLPHRTDHAHRRRRRAVPERHRRRASIDHTSLTGPRIDFPGPPRQGRARPAHCVQPGPGTRPRRSGGRGTGPGCGHGIRSVRLPCRRGRTGVGVEGPEIGRFFWSVHEAPLASLLDEWEDRMDPGLVACIRAGMGYTADDYIAMRARKLAYIERMHRFMAEWDLLLTPSVSVAAFPPERIQPAHWPDHPWDWIRWAEFSYPFNMSGLPAASVPCGFTPDGLPVGLQIVGRRGADAEVLRAAATFERARPWAGRRPPL